MNPPRRLSYACRREAPAPQPAGRPHAGGSVHMTRWLTSGRRRTQRGAQPEARWRPHSTISAVCDWSPRPVPVQTERVRPRARPPEDRITGGHRGDCDTILVTVGETCCFFNCGEVQAVSLYFLEPQSHCGW